MSIAVDTTKLLTKHFTSGRVDTIDRVILHHNAGTLTTTGCYNVWQTREASAHYQVELDGTIGRLVNDSNTAWHCAGQNANSIGIEHANDDTSKWTISDKTLDRGAWLTAQICKEYGLGTPTWGKNVFGHSDFSATTCPGEIGDSQNAAYMAKAQAYYKGTSTSSTSTSTSSTSTSTTTSSSLTVDGLWGQATTKALQKYLGTTQDGIVSNQNSAYKSSNPGLKSASWQWVSSTGSGSPMIKALQKLIGATQDGVAGPATFKALQKYLGTYQDGVISSPSNCVKALQTALNKGKF